jgi:hypothetical protein
MSSTGITAPSLEKNRTYCACILTSQDYMVKREQNILIHSQNAKLCRKARTNEITQSSIEASREDPFC